MAGQASLTSYGPDRRHTLTVVGQPLAISKLPVADSGRTGYRILCACLLLKVRVRKLFSCVVADDTGVAPNPFHDFCTLAVCKPRLLRTAVVGYWVVGTSSDAKGKSRGGIVVYAMCITETMTFDQYRNHPRLNAKRPGLDLEASWKKPS